MEKRPVTAELVMVGSELLLGQFVDTNATYLAQKLAERGIALYRKSTVGDNRGRMAEAFREAIGRADVVIISGGLGPTEDDLTREAAAEIAAAPLEYHPELFEEILQKMSRFRSKINPNNKKQAYIPKGAVVLSNPVGTAPAFIVEIDGKLLVCLPGVPREMKVLMEEYVLPYLQTRFRLWGEVIASRVLKLAGIGESAVDAQVGDFLAAEANPTVGILAKATEVLLRITARGASREEAQRLIAATETRLRERLGHQIYGADDETLESVLLRLLMEHGQSLAVLEVATGGALTTRLATAARALAAATSSAPDQAFAGGIVLPDEHSLQATGWVPTFSLGPSVCTTMVRDLAKSVAERFHANLGLAVFSSPWPGHGVSASAALWGDPGAVERDFSTFDPERIASILMEMVRRKLLGVE